MNSEGSASVRRLITAGVLGGAMLLGTAQYVAAHGGEKHGGDAATPAGGTTAGNPSAAMPGEMPMKHEDTGHGHDMGLAQGAMAGHDHGGSGHRHAAWEPPPATYAHRQSTRWADPAAIARGATLYETHCASCHGSDGRGGGPAGKALEHAPADLTVSFHKPPHDGDAYLFWRVSEGGTVEPFKSQKSQMPAFKTVLNEDQRWDVLAYVHAYFHLGLYRWRAEAMH